jgi:MFS transporter, FHS family, glucose/mannose:H+ symporter
MHLCFLVCGAGTLLLGPTLPVFAQHWHLRDSQSGLLITAQFFGLFSGSIALLRNLRHSLLCGILVAAAGFALLPLTLSVNGGYWLGAVAFYFLGLGLGQATATVNILSALRYQKPQQRSSALSLLNFTWSAGAVLSPLIAGFFLAHAGVRALFLAFAAAALALLAVAAAALPPMAKSSSSPSAVNSPPMPWPPLAYFFAVLFLYGGFEATLGGWLSTYTLRYTSLGLAASAYCTTALWASFAAGRALAAGILRYVPENAVRISGILLATLATVALRTMHTGLGIGVCAALIGLGIAPFFPVTFSLLISRAPRPRQAGAATSNIGLGSAFFPFLTGVLSTGLGSLHSAMVTPIAIALCLLALCAFQPRESSLHATSLSS